MATTIGYVITYVWPLLVLLLIGIQSLPCWWCSRLWSRDRHSSFRDREDSVKPPKPHSYQLRILIPESSRLQLQGELQSKKDAPRLYRGVFHGVSTILKNEGPKGLFRGIGAAVGHT